MNLLIIAKSNPWCTAAVNFARLVASQLTVLPGERRDAPPPELEAWRGDCLVTFMSSWVVPAPVLERASQAALNFHPGPPQYPGSGCYNFALYDGAADYGVTCHHLAAKVDTGKLVKVVRFPVLANDTVASLQERTQAYALALFYEIVGGLARGLPLPETDEVWQRRPYTRKELDALCRITPDMSATEVNRRIRATRFPGYPGPYLEVGGARFDLASSS